MFYRKFKVKIQDLPFTTSMWSWPQSCHHPPSRAASGASLRPCTISQVSTHPFPARHRPGLPPGPRPCTTCLSAPPRSLCPSHPGLPAAAARQAPSCSRALAWAVPSAWKVTCPGVSRSLGLCPNVRFAARQDSKLPLPKAHTSLSPRQKLHEHRAWDPVSCRPGAQGGALDLGGRACWVSRQSRAAARSPGLCLIVHPFP